MVTQGLLTSAEAIRHRVPIADVGDQDHVRPGQLADMPQWVRASLYLSAFFQGLSNDTSANDRITLGYGNNSASLVEFRRPEDKDVFREQLALIDCHADDRAERAPEITTQLGFATEYTAMVLGLHPAKHRYLYELMGTVQFLSDHTAIIAKQQLNVPRPDDLRADILPLISPPGHSAFPSAHATQAFATAEVLTTLLQQVGDADRANRQALIWAQAERIAVNRTVAGVHYPMDSWAGATLGRLLGRVVIGLAKRPTEVPSLRYIPENHVAADRDFSVAAFLEAFNDAPENEDAVIVKTTDQTLNIDEQPFFEDLWSLAVAEFG